MNKEKTLPRYDFKCSNQHIEEQTVSFVYDSDKVKCSCGARAVRIAGVYVPGVIFKGYGWGGKPILPTEPTNGMDRDGMTMDQANQAMHDLSKRKRT